MANSGTDLFDAYFRRADLDGDGQISGAEAVAFFQASNLPKHVLAQVWMHADSKKLGYLGRAEFYNALKLVTVAQTKRELTPEMVNAALYGPASSKIPPPRINLATAPALAPQSKVAPPTPQNVGIRPPHTLANEPPKQQFFPSQQSQFTRPLQGMPPSTIPSPQQVQASQGTGRAGTVATPRPPSSNVSTDLLGGGSSASSFVSSQSPNRGFSPPTMQDGFGLAASGLTPPAQPRPPATTAQTPSTVPKPQDTSVPANQSVTQDSKALVVSGNGFSSNSLFGDVFSATSSQPKQNTSSATPPVGSLPVSTAIVPATSGPQPSAKPSPLESTQSTFSQQSLGALSQQGLQAGKQNQQVAAQSSAATASTGFPAVAGNLVSNQSTIPVASGNSASNQSTQSQTQWPKMTQSEVQKYTKVFVQVDIDRDGKITGEQARNLFLSWRLPREVLKQVWDLSDQDNDSMLSLREFCTALYLMERYREGRPLPIVLPSNVMPDQSSLSATHQPAVPHGRATWGPMFGTHQLPTQVPAASRSVSHTAARKPPRPQPVSHADGTLQPSQQKPKVPVLEKHLADQLSQEEQDSLNSRFEEASEADKKVEELEKEIVTSREKIQFYHAKMQELIFYKSRCDNRLNEITERVSADKREVELLSKKYEEKYRQTGNVASKLTLEEATFRDIQERKMELYQAIVKMEQGDTADGAVKERADHIQSGLEELVKTLNERCKQYGLRAKPTTLLELPFGWQPGIQEGAADWDEDWDKFNDEGYIFVKDLTLDVENVIAPPKTKSASILKETTSVNVDTTASSDTDGKSPKLPSAGEKTPENEVASSTDERVSETASACAQSKDGLAKSRPESPAGTDAAESQSREIHVSHFRGVSADGSPHSKDSQSEQGGVESLFSGDKGFDEPSWGTFDTHYDTESVWGFDTASTKDMDLERHDESSLFGPDTFGLKPIRTEVLQTENTFQGKTPNYRSSVFADSVPSTPAYNFSYSPQKFSGGPENQSFDSFSRFDSFNMNDSGFFQSPRNSLSRFDSFRSTSDSDPNYGFPPRLDSFNAHDSGFQSSQNSLSRFDSARTPRDSDHSYGFDSLSRFDSLQTPREFDRSHGGFGSLSRFDSVQTPRDSDHAHGFNSFARFDSFRSTADSDHGHQFTSFDDSDPFGTMGPFRTSFESQTPKKGTDNWNAF